MMMTAMQTASSALGTKRDPSSASISSIANDAEAIAARVAGLEEQASRIVSRLLGGLCPADGNAIGEKQTAPRPVDPHVTAITTSLNLVDTHLASLSRYLERLAESVGV